MSPQRWSPKRERQYQHIKESELKSGMPRKRAEEIAARTVNKERRKSGETKSKRKTTTGTGNPRLPLEKRAKAELYNIARKQKVKGRGSMTKQELINAITL